ncbi:hypothetical protein TGPRC2_309405 [Toxoplasma gondii TgCatPRC2]|uniref:Uncharacterized protein n=1 Tax=Toxoplasma gondii TgCatPRC2 TaxID=1130821 RepID=A0A151HLB9_TOXGO|nr:hypothetical protein TGPRC2_309405 [Toxoplasma gondii TgCatPRC2]
MPLGTGSSNRLVAEGPGCCLFQSARCVPPSVLKREIHQKRKYNSYLDLSSESSQDVNCECLRSCCRRVSGRRQQVNWTKHFVDRKDRTQRRGALFCTTHFR